MYNKTIKSSTLATILLIFSTLIFSCHHKPGIAKVKPDSITISGSLGNYLEVVDNEYEVVDDWGGKLSIKLKSKGKVPDSLLKNKDVTLSLALLGDDGVPVSGTQEFNVDYASQDKLNSLIQSGNGEEIILFMSLLGGYHAETDADRVKKFSVSSVLKDKGVQPTSSSSSNDNTTGDNPASASDNTGDKNFDKLLDDYESYTDQLISLMKKANAGDASALTDYADALQKASDLDKDLADAKKSKTLSTEQLTRMFKIEQKMLTAQMQLQNKK
jgi:hypothetical protein